MAVTSEQRSTIFIPQSIIDTITRHVFHCLPQEACGVLQGTTAAGGIRIKHFVPVRNVAPDPLHHFQFDPEEWVQICLSTSSLLGVVHSHPFTNPIPSAEDLQNLPLYASLIKVYMICSPNTPFGLLDINTYHVERPAQDPKSALLSHACLSIT